MLTVFNLIIMVKVIVFVFSLVCSSLMIYFIEENPSYKGMALLTFIASSLVGVCLVYLHSNIEELYGLLAAVAAMLIIILLPMSFIVYERIKIKHKQSKAV